MEQRVIISLDKDAEVETVSAALAQAGAVTVAPIAALDDTLLATLDDCDVEAFVARVRALPGVRHAEPDRMRYSS